MEITEIQRKAYQVGYDKGYADGLKCQQPKVCSVCKREVKSPIQWWDEPSNACSECVKKAAKEIQSKKSNLQSKEKLICPECGEERPDDERVRAGIKCGRCAYGY